MIFGRICLHLVVLLVACAVSFGWQNDWDGPLHFNCPPNQFIYGVQSQHDNKKEDRRWQYSCKHSSASLSNNKWYNNVNDWDGLLAFRCHGDAVITGVRSYHDNHREDRRFSFRCSNINKALKGCHLTSYINWWDQDMNYFARDSFIVGFVSVHNNRREDRRWKVQICT